MHRIRLFVGIGLVACGAGCDPSEPLQDAPVAQVDTGAEDALRQSPQHDEAFRAAAEAFDVPPALLKAYAFAQTRYQMISGAEEFEGVPARKGLMALSGPRIEEATRLTGLSPEAIQTEPAANILAAAALLDAYAEALGIERGTLGAWAPAIARLSEIDSREGQARFVQNDVYGALRRGVGVFTDGLSAEERALEVSGEFGTAQQALEAAPDFPGGVWRPSPKYNQRARSVSMVIIHTCEGGHEGCVATLTTSPVESSAHYVVKADGTEVAQLVRESARAWHIGATYNCDLNAKADCPLQGVSVNDFSIGIEHDGFASQTTFPAAQLDASARLVCDITRDHKIPRDRQHIVAHGQLQPYDRTDPGKNWPWTDYLQRINKHCGEGTTTPPATSCVIQGAIKAKYDALGGPTGPLGKCTTDELPTADGKGRYNHFEKGSIYWHPSIGAFSIQGGIHAVWTKQRWEQGPLGYPTTDELAMPDGKGRFNEFQNGMIVWHPNVAAVSLSGKVLDHWKLRGAAGGCLGYPTKEAVTANGVTTGTFQGGTIVVSATGVATDTCQGAPNVSPNLGGGNSEEPPDETGESESGTPMGSPGTAAGSSTEADSLAPSEQPGRLEPVTGCSQAAGMPVWSLATLLVLLTRAGGKRRRSARSS